MTMHLHKLSLRAIATGLGLAALAACAPTTPGSEAAQSVGDAVAGEPLYQNNCAQCHGTDLRGTDQGPPHLDKVYESGHHADISFTLAVERGVPAHHWDFGPMPPIEGLTADDVADIIAYVREQQRAVGIE